MVLRRALMGVSRNGRIKHAVTRLPVTSDIVSRYVPGEDTDDAVAAVRRLTAAGLSVSVDFLGEDTTDLAQAEAATTAYVELVDQLRQAGLTAAAEVSIKLSALGQGLPDGDQIAFDHATVVCAAAAAAGTTVTVDMEDHTTTDSTLGIVVRLREEFPTTGAVLQAYLRRTEDDCRALATAGSRVRLCKGAYDEPESVAFRDTADVDLSYVRCLKVLMAGEGYPMVATHDPRLIEIATDLAGRHGKGVDDFEFQLLYGIRPTEQQRLANSGHRVRIYLPYGTDWYGYLVRRLAERPANLAFFARSLLTRS